VVSPQPPPPTQPASNAPPLDAQLASTQVAAAHAAGITGAGSWITVLDSGVDPSHPAVAGRVQGQVTLVDPSTNDTSRADVSGHGTAVAQVAAGVALAEFAGGVAPAATVGSVRLAADKAAVGLPYGSMTPELFRKAQDASDAFPAGPTIKIHSWGGVNWDASDTATTQAYAATFLLRSRYLSVFAAGDEGKGNPSDLAALPERVPGLKWDWLTVVALDSKHPSELANYSNRCGSTADYCIAAPGDVMALTATSTKDNPVYEAWKGTGIAAAQVGGAAALVNQAFPGISPDGIRQVLLSTADDLGVPGVDPVYGHGRLNVGKAIRGPSSIDDPVFEIAVADGHRVVFSNDIAGTGVLRVYTNGNSTLVLAGHNTYEGDTLAWGNVESMYGFPGALDVGPRVVTHGDIGGRTSVVGELVTDKAITVHGDYSQDTSGRLTMMLGAPLTVQGNATLAGDLNIAGAVEGYTKTAHQAVLTATSLSGSFDSLTMAPGVFLSSTLQYTPTEVWLDTTSLSITKVASTSMAESIAALSSARRLDGAFAQIDKSLASSADPSAAQNVSMLLAAGEIQGSRNTQVARASLESLSGQLYAAGAAVTLAGIEAGNAALVEHLERGGPNGAWSQTLGQRGGLGRDGFGTVGFSIGGQVVGTDVRVGHDGFVGVTTSEWRSSGQLSSSFDRQHSRATETMLYAGSRGERWYGVGRFGVGRFRGQMQRLLRFGDRGAFVGSENEGRYGLAYGELGYRSSVGALSLTPFANLQYASVRRSGFQELGGEGFGLSANGHTTSRWQAGLGVRAGSVWSTSHGRVRFDGKVAWQGAFATRGEVFSARYTGIAEWAPVEGIGLSRHAGTAGLVLGWDVGERISLGLDVDQRLADRDHSRSANASFRMVW